MSLKKQIILVEDEFPDRPDVKNHLCRSFEESEFEIDVRTEASMEDVLRYLRHLNPASNNQEKTPSIIIVDLFLYSREIGDRPDTVIEQIMLQPFSVSEERNDEAIEADGSSRIVLGRLGVLNLLLSEVSRLFINEKDRPTIILFSQVHDYFIQYDRPFAYTLYEVKRLKNSNPMIEKLSVNRGIRTGQHHQDLLRAFNKCIGERIQGLNSYAKEIGVVFYEIEKPYNYTQTLRAKEIESRAFKGLNNLVDAIKKALNGKAANGSEYCPDREQDI